MLRRPLLFYNEKVVEKQLPKVATYGKSNFIKIMNKKKNLKKQVFAQLTENNKVIFVAIDLFDRPNQDELKAISSSHFYC